MIFPDTKTKCRNRTMNRGTAYSQKALEVASVLARAMLTDFAAKISFVFTQPYAYVSGV